MLAATGVVGMKEWWFWSFTILLNGICYGALGFLAAFFLAVMSEVSPMMWLRACGFDSLPLSRS